MRSTFAAPCAPPGKLRRSGGGSADPHTLSLEWNDEDDWNETWKYKGNENDPTETQEQDSAKGL